MALSKNFLSRQKAFAGGFVVGFLAAKGFADIRDESVQPGVTKAYKEALKAMGPGWRKAYTYHEPKTRSIHFIIKKDGKVKVKRGDHDVY
jgi:hypothetical protein